MNLARPRILLVGKSEQDLAGLEQYLRKWLCECRAATSCRQACELLRAAPFDLVLAESGLPDGGPDHLISLLVGTEATLFFSYPVHHSCWWLPAVVEGRYCWGQPGLRPAEMAPVLDRLLSRAAASVAA